MELDKARWRPSVLPGQIVVVSTVNAQGEPNLAPKSWITMVAFAGPLLAFGCNVEHTTYQNIRATGEFVVNIPGEPLAERVWALVRSHGAERLRQTDLTLEPARSVRPPLVAECRAHLECQLASINSYGAEVLIVGNIVAGSIDTACQTGSPADRYFTLRPIFFLENDTYGSIDTAKHVGRSFPAEQQLYAVRVAGPPGGPVEPETLRRHVAFLQALRSTGELLLAGVLDGGPDGGSLYVINAASLAQAEALAGHDPLVRAGAACVVTAWRRQF